MISLGLDPSLTSYGWALHNSEETGKKRLISSGHDGTPSTTVPVVRFIQFRNLVKKIISKEPNVEIIGIESPAYSGGPFQSIHFGLMMYAFEACFEERKDIVLFDPSTLKFLAKEKKLNKTKMEKFDMQRYVQLDTLNSKSIDNNEADAYIVAKFASRFLKFKRGEIQPTDLTENERSVFLERKKKVKTLSGSKIKRIGHIFRENSRFYEFSRIPQGSVDLPEKKLVKKELLDFLESLESLEM